ncbi:MAG: LysM peptidoglycan-binding domain-containing protein [Spirochaetia bacterium]|nr:LysM peptidoglycan-binding domain-containing protein [Spirochaetia bacterium]MBQ3647674.1 LysM peptidoglycan-binding domain-containing protein [Spirochaetia bacterium]MBQ6674123.1 LysM peptidoglycan-binding domain-containing protein [Spirochaetia bacterium]MBR0318881.1 LysM peptidoglycan-binding domain-containing protein [Spirochaetia bacterium]
MNEIFNYSQLMAEPQVETCKQKKVPVQIDIAPVLKKCAGILLSKFVLKGAACLACALLIYHLGTIVPKSEKPANFDLPADSSLEAIMLSSLVSDGSAQSLAAESSSIVAYSVKAGDTLDKISRQYEITTERLAVYNNIEDARKIFPGMVLRIPH